MMSNRVCQWRTKYIILLVVYYVSRLTLYMEFQRRSIIINQCRLHHLHSALINLLKFLHTYISILENIGHSRKSVNHIKTLKAAIQQKQLYKVSQKKLNHVALMVSK